MHSMIDYCEDYDMAHCSIAFASADTSCVTIMPLVGEVNQDCLKFDQNNTRTVTYSHHAPPNSSSFMPAAIAKRFMSISLDGLYLALSWLPLNLDAEIDPSKLYTLVFKVNDDSQNGLLRSFAGDTPFRMIRWHGGCCFLPDGRLALINDKQIRVFDIKASSNEEDEEAEELYSVDLKQDTDDDGICRGDFYDDIPDIKRSQVWTRNKDKGTDKKKKKVSFADLAIDTSGSDSDDGDCSDTESGSTAMSLNSIDIFYEVNSSFSTNEDQLFQQEQQQEEQEDEQDQDIATFSVVQVDESSQHNDSDEEYVVMVDYSKIMSEVAANEEDVPPEQENLVEELPSEIISAIVEEEEDQPTAIIRDVHSAAEEVSALPPVVKEPPVVATSKTVYNNEVNSCKVKFIKKHMKTLKLYGAILITSKSSHNIWKLENNGIKLFFSLPKKDFPVDDNYVFAISKYNSMVITANEKFTFKVVEKIKVMTGTLEVYDTCSESVIARLSLPTKRKPVTSLLQVSFIQKDLYVLAVTYHYDPANPPCKNCYYIDLWDIATQTHLAGQSFISEIGFMPESQFFVNESIQLLYGCGAFIRAAPALPPSVNVGRGKSDQDAFRNDISSITAHIIPLFRDGRSKSVYQANSKKDLVISTATTNKDATVYHIWSKSKKPSQSYNKQIPALSFPVYFLDETQTHIMIAMKGYLNTVFAIWKLVSVKENLSSGPVMTILEKQIVYSFGTTCANRIDRCFGMSAIMFDPSRMLNSTSHSLNGKVHHVKSFVVPSHSAQNANKTPILVITVSQIDTTTYRTSSKDNFNNNPNYINFEYQRDPASGTFLDTNRKCRIAIPLLETSMLECSMHAIVNEREQQGNISKLYFMHVISHSLSELSLAKKDVLIRNFEHLPQFFSTVAGIQLITRLARHDKLNSLLERILKYCASTRIGGFSFHTVVSLKLGNSHTNALREAILTKSKKNIKTILKCIAESEQQHNHTLVQKYQYYIDQVIGTQSD